MTTRTVKYRPLYEFLLNSKEDVAELTRPEIEKILGFSLPKSSKMREWWANDPFQGHYQAFAWIDAGFCVTSLKDETIIFEKKSK